jgi:hypothetical protein
MKHGENKRKNLDFIQLIITRMGANSFLLKAWAVTLVAALFAIGGKDTNPDLYYLAFLPIVVFWLLDGYYLHTEKLYRELYKKVAKIDEADIDFSLDPSEFKDSIRISWLRSLFTVTEFGFYFPMIVFTALAIYLIR